MKQGPISDALLFRWSTNLRLTKIVATFADE